MESERRKSVDQAEDRISEAFDRLTSQLRDLAELQSSIQMAQAIHLGIGPHAELRENIEHIWDATQLHEGSTSSAVSSGPNTERADSHHSDDERCSSCGEWFPYHALVFHMESHADHGAETDASSSQVPLPTLEKPKSERLLESAPSMTHILLYLASQSSMSLYQIVQSFQSNKRSIRELKEELEALNGVLQSLQQATTKNIIDLARLRLPLLRCGKACKDFITLADAN